MNTLRQAVTEYLAMRRSLGFKLREAGNALPDFVTFMEQNRALIITQSLALEWAQLPVNVKPAHWAQRLGYVRGFARYRSASDPRHTDSCARFVAISTETGKAASLLRCRDQRPAECSSQHASALQIRRFVTVGLLLLDWIA